MSKKKRGKDESLQVKEGKEENKIEDEKEIWMVGNESQ